MFFDDKTEHGRYVYKKCNFIKVDIDFTFSKKPAKDSPGSSDDVVAAVSKPYLEYPARD